MDAASITVLILTILFGFHPVQRHDGAQSPGSLPQSPGDIQDVVTQATSLLEAQPVRYDFGPVSIAAGKLTTRFQVTNSSPRAVRLWDGYTSGSCTEAELRFSDGTVVGPLIPRGVRSPMQYNRTVKPGETFEVIVEFDPAAHGLRGLGRRSRYVTLELLNAPRLELAITAFVSLS